MTYLTLAYSGSGSDWDNDDWDIDDWDSDWDCIEEESFFDEVFDTLDRQLAEARFGEKCALICSCLAVGG